MVRSTRSPASRFPTTARRAWRDSDAARGGRYRWRQGIESNTLTEVSMSKNVREMYVEGSEVANRRAFLQMVTCAATGVTVAGAMPEIAAAQKASSLAKSKNMSSSQPRGGYLYMQTNEISNAIVHYRWSKSG